MKLEIRRVASLPRLSWCACIERGASTAEVWCGPWVETGRDWFVEGAWDSGFADAAFEQSCLFMGTGGRIRQDQLVVATPSHNLDPLYYVREDARLVVSNSLAFLLVRSGLDLDQHYPYYAVDLLSSRRGLGGYVRSIPVARGPRIEIRYYLNLHIDSALAVTEHRKPAVRDWRDYRDYHRFLVDGLRALKENAAAPGRAVHYELLSTMSSGYDSAASAALAAAAGGRDAITVTSGGDEVTRRELDDDAMPIGRILNMNIAAFTRLDYQQVPDAIRAEFAACGDCADINLITFAQRLPRKLLTTGHSGMFWMDDALPAPTLARVDAGGSTQAEFRLRLGYIHVPVPMLGAVRHPRLHAISRSPEMRPWSVAKVYNRPIPRRILEEQGVPRGLFARQKIGAFVLLDIPQGLEEFFERHRARRRLPARIAHAVRFMMMLVRVEILRLARRLGFVAHLAVDYWDIPYLGQRRMVVQWGQRVVQQRYRA